MCKRIMIVDDVLRRLFHRLGRHIGISPGYYLIVPALLTALAASGFQRITYEADPEYLFSPINGHSKLERKALEKHFPMNYSEFDAGRISRGGRYGRIIIVAKDNGSLLRENIFNQILFVDELVQNISVHHKEDGKDYSYQDLCAISNGYCWDNAVLGIGRHMVDIESGTINLTYPVWYDFDPYTFDTVDITFPGSIGGANLDPDGEETGIGLLYGFHAINLNYFLDSTTPEDVIRGTEWEDAFLKVLEKAKFPDIELCRFSSLTLERELEKNTNSVIPFFSLNIGLMIAFCVITCMMTDWVKSKPLLGLFGIISAIMGTLAAFGFCMYIGVPFIGINLAAPFLMLGIGIDDTFVMLGAWRRTSAHNSVPERMSEAFTDAAVSITITSITDMLSFWIGIITPFPCVKIFCIYTGTCVVFTYLWHITFFGACMAISGYAEKDNRHALTCFKVVPKSQSKNRGFLYNVFCSGGINEDDPWNEKDNRENAIMAFFRDHFAVALNKTYVKIIVLWMFLGYLFVSGWAVSNLEEGLERKRLSRFDSYSVTFYNMEDKYFREYPYRVNVIVSGQHDYSNKSVRNDILNVIRDLENTTYIDSRYTDNWLSIFLSHVERENEIEGGIYKDISTEEKFISELHRYFGARIRDVDFSDDGKHIIGARFMIQGTKIYDANQEKAFVEELRAVCAATSYEVYVFHPYFIYFDQFLMVRPTTIQCVSVAAVIMMIIALIFIPNPLCSLWVAFSICSIELGVVGFMTMWGVRLDSISMINLIMCIGFSVDFSAHISYHFMSHSSMSMEDRVCDSLYALGLPISQGAISTILGVIGLALAPSYIFITFFKMVFLVIVLGAVHGLVLLPVLLSLFGPGACSRSGKKREITKVDGKRSSNKNVPHLENGFAISDNNNLENKKGRYFSKPLHFTEELKIPRPTTTSTSRSTTTNNSSEHNTSSGPMSVPNMLSNGHITRANGTVATNMVSCSRQRHKTSNSNSNGDNNVNYNNHQTTQEAFFPVINNNKYDECNNSRRSRSRSSHAESSGSPASGSSGSDGMGITNDKRAKSVTHESNHIRRDRNYRSSSVVNPSVSDQIRKKSSSSVSQYKLCEMYTNRAYETSSELDNVSADSANSGHNRVAGLEKDFDENLPTTRVVSKHNNKQMKSSSKYIPTTTDDKKGNNDHRNSSHQRHSKRSENSKPNESNRQI